MDTQPAGTGHQPPEPADELLTKKEVAEILKMQPETIVRRHRRWGLPAHRVGRELRWWKSDVYKWIDNR